MLGFTGWGSRISVDEYLGKRIYINNVWLVNFTLLFFFALFSAGIFKLMDSTYLNFYVEDLDDITFFETTLFLTILTLIVYYLLKPESFDFFSNFVK